MHTILQLPDFAVIALLTLTPLLIIASMLGVMARGSGVKLRSRELTRFLRIEAKVDLLLNHAGLVFDKHAELLQHPGVRAAIEKGDKIKAIMNYVDATGVGLPDAKALVEGAMARRAGQQS